MTYEETLHYLYTCLPVFENSGANAYKPGLSTSHALDDYLGNPHKSYPTIHVAGTNGKGSVCHLLASVLQQSGYKVGLFTSPHLVDFRERIRVNGEMISKESVVSFVENHRSFFEKLEPSFFEITSTMAFDYFRAMKVDIAIIEVGMGGRLDSTNIISPILSIVTNISLDHTQFLGDTLEKIAGEKAGIIKTHVPVVIGEKGTESVADVFRTKASETNSDLFFAEDETLANSISQDEEGKWHIETVDFGTIVDELAGAVQNHNAKTVLCALRRLREMNFNISSKAVAAGFSHIIELTGLMGRWQTLQKSPLVICDTGHNPGGWQYLGPQLAKAVSLHPNLYMIVGMMKDKDIDSVLGMMPRKAKYFFTQASTERAMPAEQFAEKANRHGLEGSVVPSISDAVAAALLKAEEKDMIFIGGSTYVVSEAYPLFSNKNSNESI